MIKITTNITIYTRIMYNESYNIKFTKILKQHNILGFKTISIMYDDSKNTSKRNILCQHTFIIICNVYFIFRIIIYYATINDDDAVFHYTMHLQNKHIVTVQDKNDWKSLAEKFYQ